MKSKKTKTIYITRHGETDANTDPEPRVRGRIEIPLNALGIAHSKALGDYIKDVNVGKVYYSKISRAKQTAEFMAGQHSTKLELVEEPLLIDISWGDWEGKTYMQAFGDPTGGDYKHHPEKIIIPNGESFYSVLDRIKKFLDRFWNSDEDVCMICSHGAITNLIALYITDQPMKNFWRMYMNGCGLSVIKMTDVDQFTIDTWNEHHFLKEGEEKYLKKK
jgi:broad specificity phosphatase PhoE